MSHKLLLVSVTLMCTVFGACAGNDRSTDDESAANSASAPAAFCEEHQIAEAQCPFCKPELIESLGWCNGHSVPEAFCYLCNPALIPAFKATGDWCGGHDRPESQCYICNPELDPARKGETPTEPTEGLQGGLLREDVLRSERTPAVFCSTQDLLVQFDSADISRHAGLEFASVEQRSITKTIACSARLTYDGDRHAHLSSQVPGVVARIHHDLGDDVERGTPLVTITSAELGAAKAEYLQALAVATLSGSNYQRARDLFDKDLGTQQGVLEAETKLAESRIDISRAEQDLIRLGLSSDQIASVGEKSDTDPTYVLAAPFSGTVVERMAALGEVVDPGEPLLAVADVSRMWALLDVYESDILDVHTDQSVVLHVEGLRGQAVPGTITWVASHVDPRTRTMSARVEVENPHGILKANMFAEASIAVRDNQPALVVPVDAVQWEGCCNVVFVKRSDVVYEPRKVLLGVNTGTAYEVLDGLESGETVVTQGSFLLKTEILKGSIGAGCCEVQPGT
jgi:cobalt-zinc-cadmium efflux system membrane fusion protein